MKIACRAFDELEAARLQTIDGEVVEPDPAAARRATSNDNNSGSSGEQAIGDGVARFGVLGEKPRDCMPQSSLAGARPVSMKINWRPVHFASSMTAEASSPSYSSHARDSLAGVA